jgi:CRISPR/Cas system CSM-associated protein Csm3 (group 7 of RAMP superfamily)
VTQQTLQLTYQLETLTGFHVGTGYGIAGLVDRRTTHTATGAVYLPGSSLKGRVRHHLGLLVEEFGYPSHNEGTCREGLPCPLCNLLGNAAHEATLSFSDLHLSSESDLKDLLRDRSIVPSLRPYFEVSLRTNVMISRRRGVASKGHLYTTEVGAAGLVFAGRIEGYFSDAGRTFSIDGTALPQDAALLMAALLSIEHIGGQKSRGLGRCQVRIDKITLNGEPYSADVLLATFTGEEAQ